MITKIGKKKIINKEWLYEHYIVKNKTWKEISLLADCSEYLVAKFVKEYGFAKPIDKIVDARKITFVKNFGFANPSSGEDVKRKRRETNIKKYGVENQFQRDEFKRKKIDKNIDLCGVKDAPLLHKNDDADINNLASTNLTRYSADEKNNLYNDYKINNLNIKDVLAKELNCSIYNERPFELCNYKSDFKLNDSIFVNVDDLYCHSSIKKPSKYHFDMRVEFEKNNIRILQFRQDEVLNKTKIVLSMINNALGKTEGKVFARKTKIIYPNNNNAIKFLNENHIKGYKPSRYIALEHDGDIICMMTYKVVGSNMKIERFCSKVNYNVIGGFSKLLKAIEKPGLQIQYWVDLRYGTGNFLLNHGFKLDKETLGWEWTDCKSTYNRLKCRANMDDRKLSEKQHAEELGWIKIYDAGQRLYVK